MDSKEIIKNINDWNEKKKKRTTISIHSGTLEDLMKYKSLDLNDYNKIIAYLIAMEKQSVLDEQMKEYERTHKNPTKQKVGLI